MKDMTVTTPEPAVIPESLRILEIMIQADQGMRHSIERMERRNGMIRTQIAMIRTTKPKREGARP